MKDQVYRYRARPAPGAQARSRAARQPGWNTSSRSVHTHTSASPGTRSRDRFRATSNRQGTTVSTVTSAPRARSFSTVPSVEPVSSTTTWSASDMESIHRSTNCASSLQMA